MELLGTLTNCLIIPLLIVGGMIVLAVRRGFQVKQLLEDGIETTGRVVKKQTFSGSKGGRVCRIRYEYVDQMGKTHAHRSAVPEDVYASHEEGSPFPIVYSQSKPHISAPKYLVEQSRAAMAKKAGSGG